MKIFLVIILILALGTLGIWLWKEKGMVPLTPGDNLGVTPTPTPSVPTPTPLVFDRSISDGLVTFKVPSNVYGLATNQTQILTHSYIPPCDSNFNYCLYYIGTDYQGTNFESAGLRIRKRTELLNERVCLDTPPAGFSSTTKPDSTTSADTYSTSVFSSIGDAAAGHYASGSLYRLFYRQTSSCYEFETRVGQSQFMNYPIGTIKEFTTANQAKVFSDLRQILDTVSLPNGQTKLFTF
jgi:hypothetical protein